MFRLKLVRWLLRGIDDLALNVARDGSTAIIISDIEIIRGYLSPEQYGDLKKWVKEAEQYPDNVIGFPQTNT